MNNSCSSRFFRSDKSGGFQFSKMFHEGRQCHGMWCMQFGNRGWATGQPFDDGPAGRVGQGREKGVKIVIHLAKFCEIAKIVNQNLADWISFPKVRAYHFKVWAIMSQTPECPAMLPQGKCRISEPIRFRGFRAKGETISCGHV